MRALNTNKIVINYTFNWWTHTNGPFFIWIRRSIGNRTTPKKNWMFLFRFWRLSIGALAFRPQKPLNEYLLYLFHDSFSLSFCQTCTSSSFYLSLHSLHQFIISNAQAHMQRSFANRIFSSPSFFCHSSQIVSLNALELGPKDFEHFFLSWDVLWNRMTIETTKRIQSKSPLFLSTPQMTWKNFATKLYQTKWNSIAKNFSFADLLTSSSEAKLTAVCCVSNLLLMVIWIAQT